MIEIENKLIVLAKIFFYLVMYFTSDSILNYYYISNIIIHLVSTEKTAVLSLK